MRDDGTVRAVAQRLGYGSYKRYQAKSAFLFAGIPLQGKRILEIGCGNGAFCMWAVLHGAHYALGIEPEADGSTSGSSKCFKEVTAEYGIANAEVITCHFAGLPIPEKKYDVVILYNVINHLDEGAVQVLHRNAQAYNQYKDIVHRLASYMHAGSVLILGDSGRINMWNMLGLRSPVAPTIEWQKHQNARQWIRLFEDSGFRLLDFRWSHLYPLGRLASNWLVHFVTCSHYVLRFSLV